MPSRDAVVPSMLEDSGAADSLSADERRVVASLLILVSEALLLLLDFVDVEYRAVTGSHLSSHPQGTSRTTDR